MDSDDHGVSARDVGEQVRQAKGPMSATLRALRAPPRFGPIAALRQRARIVL